MELNSSSATVTSEGRKCDYCGKPINGRLDRKYCNVNCKNNFNSRLRSAFRANVHPNAHHILKAIKMNYELLLKHKLTGLGKNESFYLQKKQLTDIGFDDRFFTSIATDKWGNSWKCCFDCGFREVEGGGLELAYFPQQAEL